MFSIVGRLKLLHQLFKTGRLAWRLAWDSRTPLAAKLILVTTAAYLVSPLDLVPDWFPIVGQADDLMALVAGLHLFIRACPRWLVDEHKGRSAGNAFIEGRYRVVRD